MSVITSQDIRKMADKPIKNTFRGILRVSNITDLIENTPDEFLNNVYYGEHDTTTEWKPIGDQSTVSALNGAVARFNENAKNKRNLKLPVTDSRGYFLNLFLGENEVTIGTDSTTSNINLTARSPYFSTVNAELITMGKEPIKLLANKNTLSDDITLKIESSANNPAKFIIHSKKYHSNGELAQNDKINFKTVFVDSPELEVKPYDAFIYNQEYKDEFTDTDGKKTIVSYIRLKNIREYIERRLKSYLELNTSQVPTGTVMWHFSTLSNWYCSSDGNTVNDYMNFAGYRPALGSNNSSNYAAYNTIQGAYNGNTTLKWVNEEVLTETVCEYKRDYVLCDGKSYGISLIPSLPSTTSSAAYQSLDRFLRLFHCIGYFYTENKNNSYNSPLSNGHYITKKTNSKIEFVKVTDLSGLQQSSFVSSGIMAVGKPQYYLQKIGYNISHDILYTITMVSIMAFKAINNVLKDPIRSLEIKTNGVYDRNKAFNWLKTQKFKDIDSRYLFETYHNSSKKYTLTNNKKIKIGTLMESFDNTITYYIGGASESTTTLTTVKAYNIPEISLILDIFGYPENAWAIEFSNFFTYRFSVPKLYTSEDTTVNSYNMTDNGEILNYGLFIGSNGLSTATSISDKKLNTTVKPNELTFIQNSVCYFNSGYYPHSHAVTAGRTFDAYNVACGKDTLDTTKLPTSNTFIRSDCYADPTFKYSAQTASTYTGNAIKENYFFNVVGEATEEQVYNSFNAIAGIEYQKDGFKWYGRTSGPRGITSISDSNSNKYQNSNQYYFRPESIRMLPLIKL